ncbi:uncharacterized protein LOC129586777 [Paramacrobiotus metropolitanus]|uniref:uncharacterized protein LOC129586777 n=1 Tax=Paramacrobiotus metropolitanus TaxID=2943436 RepID=UPI0024462C74|nr:uncharacterized protein LOC129586777 [Paramacrobiotus metropolitanus]
MDYTTYASSYGDPQPTTSGRGTGRARKTMDGTTYSNGLPSSSPIGSASRERGLSSAASNRSGFAPGSSQAPQPDSDEEAEGGLAAPNPVNVERIRQKTAEFHAARLSVDSALDVLELPASGSDDDDDQGDDPGHPVLQPPEQPTKRTKKGKRLRKRARPGEKALQDIKHLQRTTTLPKASVSAFRA